MYRPAANYALRNIGTTSHVLKINNINFFKNARTIQASDWIRGANCLARRYYSPLPRYDAPRRPRRTIRRRVLDDQEARSPDSAYYKHDYDQPARTTNNYLDKHNAVYRPTSSAVAAESLLAESAVRILSEPTVVVERKVEFMNLFLGFEQENHYEIMNAQGQVIGYLHERDVGLGKIIMRQIFKLHRPFDVDLVDLEGNVVLNIKRNFSWINSHIKVRVPKTPYPQETHKKNNADYVLLGETIQQWHLWRRKYNLFRCEDPKDETYEQFGYVDSGFLAFDFAIRDGNGDVVSLINRTWGGLGKEFFTDMANYIIRMDKRLSFNGDVLDPGDKLSPHELSLQERAVLLANTVSIDFDYFSRHSRGHGGFFSFGGGDEI